MQQLERRTEEVMQDLSALHTSNTLWGLARLLYFTCFASTKVQKEAHRGGDARLERAAHFKHLVGAC
jgi:hypothetical protein